MTILILILMAVVFLGAGGTAAGCKWQVARLGWLSFLAVAGVAAFLVWRHGVWPLIPPAVAWLALVFAWWAFVPRSRLARNRVRRQNIRLRLRLHPGRGRPPCLSFTGTGGGSRRRGRPAMPGRT